MTNERHDGRRGSSGWGTAWGSAWSGEPWGGHRRRGGPPPWLAGLFGGPHESARGPKARRGDVRLAVLAVLADEQPRNGYQVIQDIADRTDGAWRPSPGSVYPTIQQLEDEGLVEGVEGEGRRLLRLSEEGRAYVADRPEELAAVWRPFAEPPAEEGSPNLKPLIGQVMAAVWQVLTTGTRQQHAEAAEILADTRRRLYGLLADGDPED